jgi:hypothetical protein
LFPFYNCFYWKKKKMINSKRKSLQLILTIGGVAAALPSGWRKPIVDSIVLPAHAQTSFAADCSGIDTEPVDEPISLTVTATEIRGPIVGPRNGATFAITENNVIGSCNNSSDRTEIIELSGTIDSAQNSISGDFIVREFCGDVLACEQITQYTATQVIPVNGDDLGEYTGRVVGTLSCCRDFL